MTDTTKCRSCGAAVFWARTKSGKNMILDAKSIEGGNVEVDGGVASVLPADPSRVAFVSHFVTCPQAKEWRR